MTPSALDMKLVTFEPKYLHFYNFTIYNLQEFYNLPGIKLFFLDKTVLLISSEHISFVSFKKRRYKLI